MTDQIAKTDTADTSAQDSTLGQDRLPWSEPTLVRDGIDAVTHGGAVIIPVAAENIFYRPS